MTKRFVFRWLRTCWSSATLGERRSRSLPFAERLRRGLAVEALEPRWLPSVSQVAFITTPQTVTAGDQSALITIQLEDSSGNPATSGSNITFTLSTNSTAGSFLSSSGGALSGNALTIPAGNSTGGFEYLDLNAGSPALTTTGGGFSATQQETVNAASTQITTQASFSSNTGSQPHTTVTEDSNGNLFGTTFNGGSSNDGTVFEVKGGSGIISDLASFNGTDGANPAPILVEDSSGNLYGTAYEGGAYGYGAVFELDYLGSGNYSSTITTLASFNDSNGNEPASGLIVDSSGNLYGATQLGGTVGDGTVFEVKAGSGAITTLASFNGTNGDNAGSTLLMDSSGNLFGTTLNGGSSNDGTVFEVKAGSGTVTDLASFTNSSGYGPSDGLVKDTSGNLFGTAGAGGANGDGTVFEVQYQGGGNYNNSATALASFNGTDGALPHGSLVEDANGNLFGATYAGGDANGDGTVFEIRAGSGTITTLASFNNTDGRTPGGGVIKDSSGDLFGTTQYGGGYNQGTVFELANGSSTITTLGSFSASDGVSPQGTLIQDGSGNLFGTTSLGGTDNDGTVFELSHGSGTLTTLASFNGTNGSDPVAGLIEDSSGNLFGTSFVGGTNGMGKVFEFANGSSTITPLASFNGSNGQSPYGSLIEDSSGNLFGTTLGGGASGPGTVFELAKGSSTITTLVSFTGTNGSTPYAGLIEDSSGDLFGTTSGGATNDGTIFELAKGSSTITTLASFNGTNGAYPYDSLIEDSSGNLFGTTYAGGTNNEGTVFELAKGSSTITTLAPFNGTDGAYPYDSLIEDSSGNLFGTTSGGTGNYGTVFELPKGSSTIITLASFNNTNGDFPYAGLIQDGGGNLFGATFQGGAYGGGTVFEVTPAIGLNLAFTSPVQTLAAGVPSTVTVQLKNQYGVSVAASSAITLNLSSTSSSGVFLSGGTPVSSVTIPAGSASVSFQYEDTVTGTPTLTASATGESSGQQQETVSAAAAHQVIFTVQPSNTTAGAAISPAVQVRILDQYGNLVSQDNSDQVTLGVVTGPGGFATGSTTTVTASGGIATFSNLLLDTAGSYSLTENATAGISGPNSSGFTINPAAANHLGFGVQPGNTTAGTALAPAVKVEVLDVYGNLLSSDNSHQVTLVASGPGGIASGSTTTATDSGGIATFGNLVLDKRGSYSLAENATGGLSGPNSSSFTVASAAATSLAVSAPGSATAGTGFSVTITGSDQYGNGYDGNVSLSANDSQTVNPITATLVNGTVTVTVTLDRADTLNLSAKAGSVTGTSGSMTVSPAAANHLAFGGQPSNSTAGSVINPAVTVEVLDIYGNVLTADNSDQVTVFVANGPGGFVGGSGTYIATVSGGIATFSNLKLDTAGSYTLGAVATGGLTGPSSSSFSVTPAAPSVLAFGVQPTGTTAGAAINPAVTVNAFDPYGNLTTNNSALQVTLSAVGGPGGFTSGSTTTVTINDGVGSFSNLMLDAAGSYTLAESATGGVTGPNSSGFTINPAAADHLGFAVQPSNTTAGVAIAPPVIVKILDKYGNLETGDNTDQVALSFASGPGSFTSGSTTTVTVSGGSATFNNLVLDTAGSYSLAENATGGLTGSNSASFTINPAAPTQLSFGVEPGTTTAGTAMNPAVTVDALDPYGNLATNNNTLQVTLSVATGPGGFASGSTATVTVSGGIATFNNLVLDTAGSYTLAESATGNLSGPNSSSFTITPAVGDHLAFSVQPSTTTAGAVISPAVQVQVFDQYGNLLTGDNSDPASLSVASGPGSFIAGSTTTVTVNGGIAAFGNLVIDKRRQLYHPRHRR